MMKKETLNFDGLIEDYATKPVPVHISTSGLRIAMINTALACSLPALLTGVQLSTMISIKEAVSAIIWGGIIVAIIGAVAGMVGLRNRISTYMLLRFSFGLQGSRLVNLCMALSLFGWFGVNVYLFSQAARELLFSLTAVEVQPWCFVLTGGLLMTAGTIFGFKSVQRLALLIVPVQMLILIFLLNKIVTGASLQELLTVPVQNQLTLGEAISAVVGSFIVAAVIMPDFTRYGKTWMDSVLASFIPFLCATTIVYSIAAFAAVSTGKTDILELMLAMGMGLSAFVLVIFSSWITNSVNLYSCSLSIVAIFPKLREWQVAIVSGSIGTGVAFFGILEHFIDFIFSLGIIFSPIVGIYVVDYFILRNGHYDIANMAKDTGISCIALVSWLLGIVAAYGAGRSLFHLTGIASCDALLVATLSYLLLKLLRKTKIFD